MPSSLELYTYRAVLQRVVDGDTIWLDIDLGGRIHAFWDCRMRGYDAPGHASAPGQQAILNLSHLLTGVPLIVQTSKDGIDKYGRYLVTIALPDGRDVCTTMIADGSCLAWDGHGGHPNQPGHE